MNGRQDINKTLIYVIGDSQGDYLKLDQVLYQIEHNPSQLPLASNDKIVLLGNFLDSNTTNMYEIMMILKTYKKHFGDQLTILQGAFEQRFLYKLHKQIPNKFVKSLFNSYRYEENRGEIDINALKKDLDWLHNNMQTHVITDKFFISSGTPNPKFELEGQPEQALTQIFTPFIKSKKRIYKKIVVHGSLYENNKVFINKNRINLNTNCAKKSGTLYCAILDDCSGNVEEFIQSKVKNNAKKSA